MYPHPLMPPPQSPVGAGSHISHAACGLNAAIQSSLRMLPTTPQRTSGPRGTRSQPPPF